MKSRWGPFNIYLAAAVALVCVCGCKTEESKRKKVLATFKVHLEARPDPMGRSQEVTIGRDNPVKLTVEKAPFLVEAHVKEAKVVDVLGGFVLQVQLDHEGAMLLEQYTSANPGRHLAIFSQFRTPPDETLNQGRWLAAPRIATHITDGLLAFTPDASREEADMIVLGLSNVAKKLETGKDPKW
ncbi:MAG TPA: hypothetical protein VNZ64_08500 [Candidatus Acidoferrum sp.]|jgi:preprotein translocase subunit SecD|nr:hypothetical protein [Candidatus Acidoferrum sp.]